MAWPGSRRSTFFWCLKSYWFTCSKMFFIFSLCLVVLLNNWLIFDGEMAVVVSPVSANFFVFAAGSHPKENLHASHRVFASSQSFISTLSSKPLACLKVAPYPQSTLALFLRKNTLKSPPFFQALPSNSLFAFSLPSKLSSVYPLPSKLPFFYASPSKLPSFYSRSSWRRQVGRNEHCSHAENHASPCINEKFHQKSPLYVPYRAQEKMALHRLLALNISHIVVKTESMATSLLTLIKTGDVSFSDMAKSISLCKETAHKGGLLGWLPMTCFKSNLYKETNASSVLSFLHGPVFLQAFLSKKPGDFVIFSSFKGWHLFTINDIAVEIAPQKFKRKRLAGRGWLPPNGLDMWMNEGHTFFFPSSSRTTIPSFSFPTNSTALSVSLPFTSRSTSSSTSFYSPSFSLDANFPLHWTASPSTSFPVSSVSLSPATSFSSPLKPLLYFIETLGCQMNKADSERMAGQMEYLGFQYTENAMEADVVILNTCSIRDHAEQKVYSYLGPHAARKQRGENILLIVAGCVPQQEGAALLRRFPAIDIILGPQFVNRLATLIEETREGYQVVATSPSYIMEDLSRPRRESVVTDWVNIIYGCNERCSYCVVPFTRGVEQSRPKESIYQEIEALVASNYKEVVLLGQNIDSWGRDMIPKQRFSDLLYYLAKTNIPRIRFITSHPRYMTARVVEAVASCPSLCEHFHIPFQSGDSAILKHMKRGYTRERYIEIVTRIRSLLPEASITADAIVGFPGETEAAFQQTLSLMEEIQFDNVFTFAYSPRPNTAAATFEDQVEEHIKEERLQRINALNAQHALQRNKRLIGSIQEVLVEAKNPKDQTQVYGRSRGNQIVFFDGNIQKLQGKILFIRIENANSFCLYGKWEDA